MIQKIIEVNVVNTDFIADVKDVALVLKKIPESIPENPPESVSEVESSPFEQDSNHYNYFFLQINQALSIDASVDYRTVDGTAKSGEDYIAASGTATITSGKTYTSIPVEIIGDSNVEEDETFELILSNPQGAKFPSGVTELRSSRTIRNDD